MRMVSVGVLPCVSSVALWLIGVIGGGGSITHPRKRPSEKVARG